MSPKFIFISRLFQTNINIPSTRHGNMPRINNPHSSPSSLEPSTASLPLITTTSLHSSPSSLPRHPYPPSPFSSLLSQCYHLFSAVCFPSRAFSYPSNVSFLPLQLFFRLSYQLFPGDCAPSRSGARPGRNW
jgi:hypothetical protein